MRSREKYAPSQQVSVVYSWQMRRLILISLFFISLIFIVYPHAFLTPRTTLPDDNDTRLIAYIIGQVQNNLLHHQPLYFGTFFAPYENTLTYSEPFVTSTLITLPFRLFSSQPILILNQAFIINFFLTLAASFLLFRYLFDDDWLAIFLTTLFNLSGFHLTYLPHLQVFSLWPVFLSFYFFLRFSREAGSSAKPGQNSLFLILFFLTLSLQIFESLFGAYLIFFGVFFIFLKERRYLTKIILHSLLFLPLWAIFLFPYLKLHFTFAEAIRPIRDAAHFSLGLEEIFTSYHSLAFIVVLILSLFPKIKGSEISHWKSLLIFSLVMSFGPVIKIMGQTVKIFGIFIPLPYALFYYLFPGFTGFRTPSRFIILAAIAATIIIGSHLAPTFKKLLPQTKFFLLSLLLLILILEFHLPRPAFPVDIKPPKVYQIVKLLDPSSIILELPIKLWNDDGHEIESIRSLYSLDHGLRRVGGYSGFAPLAWIDLVENLKANGLSAENKNRLHALGVTHIIENNHLYVFKD